MINKWHKGRTSISDSNLASIEEVKERLDYFRTLSRQGIGNLTDLEVESLSNEIIEYFSDWAYFVNKLQKGSTFFRVTVNKRITQKNEHALTKVSQLTGPPIQYLKNRGRCNGLEVPVFYCAYDLKAALFEAVPEIGDAITVSQWRLRDKKEVYYCHVFHPEVTAPTPNNKVLFNEFMKEKKKESKKLSQITGENLRFLTEEYIKPVSSGLSSNYIFSSLFSEIIFRQRINDGNKKLQAVLYPSTKIRNGQTNVAFPDSITHDIFELVEIRAGFVDNIWPTPDVAFREIDMKVELPFSCKDFNVAEDWIGSWVKLDDDDLFGSRA